MSRLHSRTSADFASLARELERQSPSTSVVILNHRNLRSLRVPAQTIQQMYHLATSRACGGRSIHAFDIPCEWETEAILRALGRADKREGVMRVMEVITK